MKKGGNTLLIVLGLLLAVGAFAGYWIIGRTMNPNPEYILVAANDISENTDLSTLSTSNFFLTEISADQDMIKTFVSSDDFLKMQREGGRFVNFVARNEPIKYTDISSSANPMSSRIVSLGMDDPNSVVMTINASSYIPNGINSGDYVDLIASITKYDTEDAYADDLANLIRELQRELVAGKDVPDTSETIASIKEEFANRSSNSSSQFSDGSIVSFDTGNLFGSQGGESIFEGSSNQMAEEIMEKAEELEAISVVLEEKLARWEEFLDAYETIDPETLASKMAQGYYLAPIAKVLVQGAKVVRVNRDESISYDGSSYTAGDVYSIDVLVPRDAIEWVTMADASGNLRVAVLSSSANPAGSGPTLGAALQDLIENFVNDREDKTDMIIIPSSR